MDRKNINFIGSKLEKLDLLCLPAYNTNPCYGPVDFPSFENSNRFDCLVRNDQTRNNNYYF